MKTEEDKLKELLFTKRLGDLKIKEILKLEEQLKTNERRGYI